MPSLTIDTPQSAALAKLWGKIAVVNLATSFLGSPFLHAEKNKSSKTPLIAAHYLGRAKESMEQHINALEPLPSRSLSVTDEEDAGADGEATKMLRRIAESWGELAPVLPSTRLSDYLSSRCDASKAQAVRALPLAARLLDLIEELYLLLSGEPATEEEEAVRLEKLCRVLGEPVETVQRVRSLMGASAAELLGENPAKLEETLLSLERIVPSTLSFKNSWPMEWWQLTGASFILEKPRPTSPQGYLLRSRSTYSSATATPKVSRRNGRRGKKKKRSRLLELRRLTSRESQWGSIKLSDCSLSGTRGVVDSVSVLGRSPNTDDLGSQFMLEINSVHLPSSSPHDNNRWGSLPQTDSYSSLGSRQNVLVLDTSSAFSSRNSAIPRDAKTRKCSTVVPVPSSLGGAAFPKNFFTGSPTFSSPIPPSHTPTAVISHPSPLHRFLPPEPTPTLPSSVNEIKPITLFALQQRINQLCYSSAVKAARLISMDLVFAEPLFELVLKLVVALLKLRRPMETKTPLPGEAPITVFIHQCEMHLVVDLVPLEKAPSGEAEREAYRMKIEEYYREREKDKEIGKGQLFSESKKQSKVEGTVTSWSSESVRRSMIELPHYSGNVSSDQIISHSTIVLNAIVESQTPDDASSSCTSLPLPEVWAVHVGETIEEKSVVHPKWYLSNQLRELLSKTSAVVVATGCGAATIAFPFVTQQRLELLKKMNVVTDPLSATAERRILSINELVEKEIAARQRYRQNPVHSIVADLTQDMCSSEVGRDDHSGATPSVSMGPGSDLNSSLANAVSSSLFTRLPLGSLRLPCAFGNSTTASGCSRAVEEDYSATQPSLPKKTNVLKSVSTEQKLQSEGSMADAPVESMPHYTSLAGFEVEELDEHILSSKMEEEGKDNPPSQELEEIHPKELAKSTFDFSLFDSNVYPTLNVHPADRILDPSILSYFPNSEVLAKIDNSASRIAILSATPCSLLLHWLTNIKDAVTWVNTASKVECFLRSGIGVYDLIIIEWCTTLMTPSNIALLQKSRHANLHTPFAYCILGEYPSPSLNHPPLPTQIHLGAVTYGRSMEDCCVPKRSTARRLIRMGRLLRFLQGDHGFIYQVMKKIGSGRAADVFEVKVYASKGRLAMKRILIGPVTHRRLELLVLEVFIQKELVHPNIVLFSHVRCSATYLQIFMELCDYSLEDLLRNRLDLNALQAKQSAVFSSFSISSPSSQFFQGCPPTELVKSQLLASTQPASPYTMLKESITKVVSEIVSAVNYIHSLDIVHRDLKPHNILFLDGVVKLADFGSATTVRGAQYALHIMKEALPYMAPEVFLGELYRKPGDVWSLGMLIAEMLGLHLAHSTLLHFPSLRQLYEALSVDESMPVVVTNYLYISAQNQHFSDILAPDVLRAYKIASNKAQKERREGAQKFSSSIVDVDPKRAVYVVEVDSKSMKVTTSHFLLPASLIELLESTFHRTPEKRITTEQLLEHPIANDREWVQRMVAEVKALNTRIGFIKEDDRNALQNHLDLSLSLTEDAATDAL